MKSDHVFCDDRRKIFDGFDSNLFDNQSKHL